MNVKAYNTFKTKLSIGLKNYPFKIISNVMSCQARFHNQRGLIKPSCKLFRKEKTERINFLLINCKDNRKSIRHIHKVGCLLKPSFC